MLSELSPQTALVLRLGLFGLMLFGALAVSFFRVTGFGMLAMSGALMLLVQLLGFLPIVAFAGNEGNGGNRKEHRENFHRAPCIAAA